MTKQYRKLETLGLIRTSINGHDCSCIILAQHGAGTIDVEVCKCDTCPGLVHQCFRVSGLGVAAC